MKKFNELSNKEKNAIKNVYPVIRETLINYADYKNGDNIVSPTKQTRTLDTIYRDIANTTTFELILNFKGITKYNKGDCLKEHVIGLGKAASIFLEHYYDKLNLFPNYRVKDVSDELVKLIFNFMYDTCFYISIPQEKLVEKKILTHNHPLRSKLSEKKPISINGLLGLWQKQGIITYENYIETLKLFSAKYDNGVIGPLELIDERSIIFEKKMNIVQKYISKINQ